MLPPTALTNLFDLQLTIDDMKKFEEEYRFSAMEAEDLIATYVECEGDMDLIFENQMCSHIEDEDRFRYDLNLLL